MKFQYNDGGRKESGRKGDASDCVARAIAIASCRNYADIYADLANGNAAQRPGKYQRRANGRTASHGIQTSRKWFKDYMIGLGFKWVPTMGVGTGCKVHLRDGELPMGHLVVSVSRHYVAVIDGVIHDTHDPSRGGNRCVYGYWTVA